MTLHFVIERINMTGPLPFVEYLRRSPALFASDEWSWTRVREESFAIELKEDEDPRTLFPWEQSPPVTAKVMSRMDRLWAHAKSLGGHPLRWGAGDRDPMVTESHPAMSVATDRFHSQRTTRDLSLIEEYRAREARQHLD